MSRSTRSPTRLDLSGHDVRVAIYLRISTDETNQPFSLAAQEDDLRAFVAVQRTLGWRLVRDPYVDRASGKDTARPALQALLRDARAGLFDLVLVWKMDRLSRSQRDFMELLDLFTTHGIALVSRTQPFDTSGPMGKFLVGMLACVAELERDTIIERVTLGMGEKAKRGGWLGGFTPYGYALRRPAGSARGDGELVVESAEAALVGVIFNLYVRDNLGARAIANWLNEHGHRTRNGRRWTHKTLLGILRNRVCVGEIKWKGEWYPAVHTPILDRAIFDQAQELLAKRGEDHTERRALSASDYDFTGIFTCSCGGRVVGTAATGRSATYRYYTCLNRVRLRTCDEQRIPADELEAAVYAQLLALYDDPDWCARAASSHRRRHVAARRAHEKEAATIAAELAKVAEARRRYQALFENGRLDPDEFADRMIELRNRDAELRHRQADLVAALAAVDTAPPTDVELAAIRAEIEVRIAEGPSPARKRLAHALIHQLKITGPRVVTPVFKVRRDIDTLDQTGGPDDAEPDQRDQGAVRTRGQMVRRQGLEPRTRAAWSLTATALRPKRRGDHQP